MNSFYILDNIIQPGERIICDVAFLQNQGVTLKNINRFFSEIKREKGVQVNLNHSTGEHTIVRCGVCGVFPRFREKDATCTCEGGEIQ